MKNIFTIAKNILKISLGKKGNWITFLLLPLLSIFAALAFNSGGNNVINVGVYDENNSYLSQDVIKSIGENENFKVYSVNSSDFEEVLKNNNLQCIVEIPKEFEESILNNSVEDINIYSSEGTETTSWIENYLNFYVDNLKSIGLAAKGDKETFDNTYKEFKDSSIKFIDKEVNDKTKNKGVTKQSIGFLLVFMLMASKVTTDYIMKDKSNRTFFRIFSSSLTKSQYIIANILANMTIYIFQVSLIILISTKLLHLNFYTSILNLYILFICFGIASIAFGILIAAFSKSISQSSQLQNIIIVPTSMLAGCFWPVEIMPDFMQKLAMIFPQSWVLKAIDNLQFGEKVENIIPYLLMILIFAVAVFIVALVRFRNDEDIRNVI